MYCCLPLVGLFSHHHVMENFYFKTVIYKEFLDLSYVICLRQLDPKTFLSSDPPAPQPTIYLLICLSMQCLSI